MNLDRERKDTLSIIIAVIGIIVSVILFSFGSPKKINLTAIIILISIVIATLIISIYIYINSEWKNMNKNIISNRREINEIKKSLKYEQDYYNMKERVSILESILKSKKAQIDPRIIFWILFSVLIYLFLKSMNIIH